MKAQDIMTAHPACCSPDDTAEHAAHLMDEHDCGCLPVVTDEGSRHLLGIVTDRDIALRGVGRGGGANTRVSDLMTAEVSCCAVDSDIEEVERIMAERQVRRVPVLDDRGACIGIIAQADLAREAGHAVSDAEVGRVVEQISEPGPSVRWEHDDERFLRM
jgi:CBS domain-containing protein